MGPRPVRKNGFQLPHSEDQQTVMICYPLVTASFVALLVWMEYRDLIAFIYLLVPHIFLVVVLLCNWFMVESLNPQDSPSPESERGQLHPGIEVVCFDQSRITTRYCATCRKQVYGMDHHCTWLNTCVGARNYVYFFSLVVTGTCQMLYQTLTGVMYMTLWRGSTASGPDSGRSLVVFYTLVSVFSFASLVFTLAFGSLMGFHLYLLLWVRAGTYDWMVGAKSSHIEQTRAQKLREETAYRSGKSGAKSGTDVRHGYITASGDVELGKDINEGEFSSESSCGVERMSASGDDLSEYSNSGLSSCSHFNSDSEKDYSKENDNEGKIYDNDLSVSYNVGGGSCPESSGRSKENSDYESHQGKEDLETNRPSSSSDSDEGDVSTLPL